MSPPHDSLPLGNIIGDRILKRLIIVAAALAVFPLGNTAKANNGDDFYDGGPGIDTISFAGAKQPVTVNLVEGTAFGHDIGNDTLRNIENVIGGHGHDRIIGDANDNQLDGGPGGSDFIDGGAGFDTAVFHKDRKSYRIARVSAGEISVSDGVDTDTLKNIDALKFSDGTMRINEVVFD